MKEQRSETFNFELEYFKYHYPEYVSIIEPAFIILERLLQEKWDILKHTINVNRENYLIKHDGRILDSRKNTNEKGWYWHLGQVIIWDAERLKNLLKETHTKKQIDNFLKKYFADKQLKRMVRLLDVGFDYAYEFMFINRTILDGTSISPEFAEVYHLLVSSAGENNPTKHFRLLTKQLFEKGQLQKTKLWKKIKGDDSSKDQKVILDSFKIDVRDNFGKWYKWRITKRGFTNRQILNELEEIMNS